MNPFYRLKLEYLSKLLTDVVSWICPYTANWIVRNSQVAQTYEMIAARIRHIQRLLLSLHVHRPGSAPWFCFDGLHKRLETRMGCHGQTGHEAVFRAEGRAPRFDEAAPHCLAQFTKTRVGRQSLSVSRGSVAIRLQWTRAREPFNGPRK